jgi:hypothetical protein
MRVENEKMLVDQQVASASVLLSFENLSAVSQS